ncbi:MAG: hypothetical protein R3C45_05925 [Phycisphaerales bacterium]
MDQAPAPAACDSGAKLTSSTIKHSNRAEKHNASRSTRTATPASAGYSGHGLGDRVFAVVEDARRQRASARVCSNTLTHVL